MTILIRRRMEFNHLDRLVAELQDQFGQILARDQRGEGHAPQSLLCDLQETASRLVAQQDLELSVQQDHRLRQGLKKPFVEQACA